MFKLINIRFKLKLLISIGQTVSYTYTSSAFGLHYTLLDTIRDASCTVLLSIFFIVALVACCNVGMLLLIKRYKKLNLAKLGRFVGHDGSKHWGLIRVHEYMLNNKMLSNK